MNCKCEAHKTMINDLCNRLSDIMVSATRKVFPIRRKGKTKVPIWTDNIEPLKRTALFWHAIWCENNRPEDGVVANIHRKTRSDNHKKIELAVTLVTCL